MNRFSFAIMIAIWIAIIPLSATNHLDVMTYMSGEFNGSDFGNALASLDFNADGYMDLVVSAKAWNPNMVFQDQNCWGKLYFFWGGPNFDNEPDFVIPGVYVWQMALSYSLYNAGDMNGDGVEDLIVNQLSSNNESQVAVYFGRQNPQTTPDVLLTFPYPEVGSIRLAPLGDVNGDNRADISLTQYLSSSKKVCIWTDYLSQPVLFRQTANRQTASYLSGIGDVNGDGYDDCFLRIPIFSTGETHNRLVVYYGSTSFTQADSLVISNDTNLIDNSWGSPLGDVNGDGIDDFIADSSVYDYTQHMWLGSGNLSADWDITLSGEYFTLPHQFNERGTGYPFVHGDLNGDGYQDFLSFHHEAGYYDGYLYLWLGKAVMNGTMDFLQLGIDGYSNRNFGYSKITGDFNADGLCDVAVGAPWFTQNDHVDTGRVYVFSGNSDLHDTTVANDDPAIPAIPEGIKVHYYPNPNNTRDKQISYTIEGKLPQTIEAAIITIHNIKGQVVERYYPEANSLKSGAGTISLKKLKPGIYIAQLRINGKKLSTERFTIVK